MCRKGPMGTTGRSPAPGLLCFGDMQLSLRPPNDRSCQSGPGVGTAAASAPARRPRRAVGLRSCYVRKNSVSFLITKKKTLLKKNLREENYP